MFKGSSNVHVHEPGCACGMKPSTIASAVDDLRGWIAVRRGERTITHAHLVNGVLIDSPDWDNCEHCKAFEAAEGAGPAPAVTDIAPLGEAVMDRVVGR
jgi:hypothetical protein